MMTSIALLVVCTVGLVKFSHGSAIKEEIFHGFNAMKGQFPYQALLINHLIDGNSTFCGGSLISTFFVLTAAHCSRGTNSTRVYLGMTDTSDGNGAFYYDVDAYNTFIHPLYNPNNYQNDLSLLRLSTTIPVRLSNLIKLIKLPKLAWSDPTYFDNFSVTASGWGQTYDTEVGIHRMLQYRQVHKMPEVDCGSYYTNLFGFNPLTCGMICTDKNVVYAGPCHGDSGGPLTVKLRNDLYLIGAVSWGVGNCSSKNPVVFTNVAAYLTWINLISGIPIS